jgi:hypothetical protein
MLKPKPRQRQRPKLRQKKKPRQLQKPKPKLKRKLRNKLLLMLKPLEMQRRKNFKPSEPKSERNWLQNESRVSQVRLR